MRESERFLNSWVFEGISNPWIWTPQIQDGFGPNPNSILLSYPNKGFGFGLSQIQIQIQIQVIQTDHKITLSLIIKKIHFKNIVLYIEI